MSPCTRAVLLGLATSILPMLTGCVVEGHSAPETTSQPTPVAPAIATQPASLTVPISLSGILTVSATGSSLNYQWSLNGTAISGATSPTYTTPAVSLPDSGDVYTVTISNSSGSVTSQPATITAGARAPKAGDLRFQQVDSLNTINGYTGFSSAPGNLPANGAGIFSPAFGTLTIDSENCSVLLGCVPFISVFAQPSNAIPLAAGFTSGFYSNLETNLSTGIFPNGSFGGGPILASNTVVTGLQLDPADNVYDLSYIQTSGPGGFDAAQHTVNVAQIQAAATIEGQSSRVITAISYNSGQLTYFSYGWSSDTTTVYDTFIATPTFANVGTAASSLAAQGYIITAVGGNNNDSAVLVGTRVHGDALARPILIQPSFVSDPAVIPFGGYAVVGIVNNAVANPATGVIIGER